MKHFYLCMLFFVFALTGCNNPTVYTRPDFSIKAKEHKTVAILPFYVFIDSKNQDKNFTNEVAHRQGKEEGYILQNKIYSKFLERKEDDLYTVDFQDVEETNAILAKNGVTYENIGTYTKGELAKMLHVDSVFYGNLMRRKPTSNSTAVITLILFGVSTNTNSVNINVGLYDKDNNMLWKYDYKLEGSLGSSLESISNHMFNSISKRHFPYMKEQPKPKNEFPTTN